MSEDVLAQIFDPIFPQRKTRELGFASTLRVVTPRVCMGWSQERVGTMFHIYLPVADKPAEPVIHARGSRG